MWRTAVTRFQSMSIRTQLLVVILLLMVPLVMLIIQGIQHEKEEAIRAANRSTREMADSVANETEQLVTGAQQLASTISQLSVVERRDRLSLQPLLERLLGLNSQFANISVTDRAGMTWVSALPMERPFSIADRRYFRNAMSTGRFSSGEFTHGKLSGKPILGFAYPIFNGRGVFDGAIVISLDLDHFRQVPPSTYPPGTSITLLDHRGTVLARTLDNDIFLGKPADPRLFRRIASSPDGSSFRAAGIDGVERFSSHRKLSLPGETTPCLYIRAGIPAASVLDGIRRHLLISSGISLAVLLAAFALAWLAAKRSILDRVHALELACNRVAAGDLEVRVASMVQGGEVGRLGIIFDSMATQLAEREQELISSRNMLQELNHRLEAAREQERAHIAREVHDVMGQSLTALKLDLNWLLRNFPVTEEKVATRSEEMMSLIDSAIAVVQSITAELSPPLLDLGLAEAIEWHAREFEQRSGIACILLLDEGTHHLMSREHEALLFRIFQEALTNVARHAEATEVSVSLCVTPSAVVLEVADNGKGISGEAIASPAAFGLLGMRERAAICGGTLSVRGTPGKGTIVKLEVGHKQG